MRSDLPTGSITFLFTDVAGSTKLLHELGVEAYAEELASHRRVVREACADEGGVEVDTQGDAFFFAFSSAPGAVAAARAMTEALAGGQIHLRIGLHTGTPLVTGEGYVGDDVHLAARVAACGHGDQVLLSKTTRVLVDGLSLTDLGEHRLKDIEEAVSIYQLGDKRFPPLKTISNTNLPRPASSFLGRERELEEVLAELRDGARLVTFTGPGGSGKTRLALETAAELVPTYSAGVFWVGLASLRDPSLVTETISQSLGARDGLAEHIGEREMLLLLDNLEQVIDAAPELSALLAACPNLVLLVTSRELLRVEGELEYAVPPLASADAVSLFCGRSRLEPSAEIAELCDRLDDLPLAVELAAARTKALSPTQILERVSERLDLLRGRRDADPRQQTLRATIAWSYDLLTEEERRVFRALSVFAGGCTLEAAEIVCDAGLNVLESIVDKSLLLHTGERFRMLETIREFAAERLCETGDRSSLQRAHAEFFARLADEAEPQLIGSDSSRWVEELRTEHDNLRAALSHARDTADGHLMLRLAGALSRFWSQQGHLREGRAWLEEALARSLTPERSRALALGGLSTIAFMQGDIAAMTDSAQVMITFARSRGDVYGRLVGLNMLGNAALLQDDLDRAWDLYSEIAEQAREVGSVRMQSIAVGNLGNTALQRGELTAALELYLEAATLDRLQDDPYSLAVSLHNVATAQLQLGHLEPASQAVREAIGLFAELRTTNGLYFAFTVAAALAAATGKPAAAARLLGNSEAMRADSEYFYDQIEQQTADETMSRVRNELGAAADEAMTEGKAMSLDEAVALALSID